MDTPTRIVVVGGGLAGAKAVEALREKGFDGSLTLLSAESNLPYERPPLSKGYLQGEDERDAFVVHPQQWYQDHDVDLRLGTRATELSLDGGTVGDGDGDPVPFDRVLLATGSAPRTLDLPGSELDGVMTLRTVEDSERLREAFGSGVKVVVIGGGWIGLETAAAARAAECDVTVLESADLPLLATMGERMASVFATLHRDNGVDLRTGVTVAGLRGDGTLSGVELSDGTLIEADLVVMGVGARPLTELAEHAGLDVDNGVLVDAQMRSSDPRVFAVGDIANAEHPVLGQRIRVEHWANALNQPEVAAAAMLGGDDEYRELPYFYTDQFDLGMEYIGHADPASDEVVVRGDEGGREFIAFWLRDGVVKAGMNVNIWDVVDDIKALILSGRTVDPARLADPEVALADV